jgi:hypothetical protein
VVTGRAVSPAWGWTWEPVRLEASKANISPSDDSFLQDSQPHSPAMGQKTVKKWTAVVDF